MDLCTDSDSEAGKSKPAAVAGHLRAPTNEDLLQTQADIQREKGVVIGDTIRLDGGNTDGPTPISYIEGTMSGGINNQNYNTDELKREVDREVAQIQSFFMADHEDQRVGI
jgi:hypothetical protein